MYRRLCKFLELHKILYSLQFGLQENHSIDHALVSLTEALSNTLDSKRLNTVNHRIDLQKAFDTVNHRILLSKFEHCGIHGEPLSGFNHV